MRQCLVTTLRSTVNNPNLPILETMQQFTLDAIAASGNSSMTDAQKWALNHFFYKIGAIGNTGIYDKLNMLYLPLICGQNLDKALVDYKSESVISIASKRVVFQNNGLLLDSGASTESVLLSSSYSGSVNDFSVAAMFTDDLPSGVMGAQNMFGFRRLSTDTLRTVKPVKTADSVYLEVFSKKVGNNLNTDYKGFVFNYKATNTQPLSACFVDESPFMNNNVGEQTLTPPDSLSYAYIYWNSVIPVGIYALGDAMTEEESITFAEAMYELKEAFVTV